MPQDSEEEGNDTQRTGSSVNIVRWWRKFHFSGRLIMCSVLFGLGIILVGGLIFAINMDDDSSKTSSDETDHVPTKAPSNYIGPVVMGIGGFIVVVGVIMCLFETQVFRKKTGDSSPLIGEKIEDPERKGSEPAAVPSTSHSHKNHRHGARKKSKGRHAKSHSKDRNQQTSTSPRSPPVSIEPSKVLMTSGEDKFVTPPNTIEKHTVAVKTDDKSALMKSFTSSGQSTLNQSSEFLTPGTSFRDSSVSFNNSIEVDENQDQENQEKKEFPKEQLINAAYMTPLTVEEDRFQQVLMRVQKEQKEAAIAKKEIEDEELQNSRSSSHLSSTQGNTEIAKEDKESRKKENVTTNELPLKTLPDSSISKDDEKEQVKELENADELKQIKTNTDVSEETLNVINNKEVNETLAGITDINNMHSTNDNQEEEISVNDSTTPLGVENEDHGLVSLAEKEIPEGKTGENDMQVDLESSVSSDETVVSPDNLPENPMKDDKNSTENASVSTTEEISSDVLETRNVSKSQGDLSTANNDGVNPQNTQINIPPTDEAGAHDLNHIKNDVKIANDQEESSKNESS